MIVCFTEKDEPTATPSSETKNQKIHTEQQVLPVVTVKFKENGLEEKDSKSSEDKSSQLDDKDIQGNQDKITDDQIKENNGDGK